MDSIAYPELLLRRHDVGAIHRCCAPCRAANDGMPPSSDPRRSWSKRSSRCAVTPPKRDCRGSGRYGAWLYSNEYTNVVRCMICTSRSSCALKVRLLPLRRRGRSDAAKPHEFFKSEFHLHHCTYQSSRLISVITTQHYLHAQRHASSSTCQRCLPHTRV